MKRIAIVDDDERMRRLLKSYIDKYLRDNDYHVECLTTKELIDKLYREMAEYSVLTPYLAFFTEKQQFRKDRHGSSSY